MTNVFMKSSLSYLKTINKIVIQIIEKYPQNRDIHDYGYNIFYSSSNGIKWTDYKAKGNSNVTVRVFYFSPILRFFIVEWSMWRNVITVGSILVAFIYGKCRLIRIKIFGNEPRHTNGKKILMK